MANNIKTGITIRINGQEVANSFKSIAKEARILRSQLDGMTIGSEEYNRTAAELRRVDGIIQQHRQGLKSVESTWSKMAGGIGKFAGVAGVAFGVGEIVSFGKELFRLGTEMEVMANKARTVFGEALPQVEAAAESNANAMGLTTRSYIDQATAIGDLLVPMGFQREEAAGISTELVNLSGALSEWTGGQKSAEEVSNILSKAILGEREQLKTLGISIQEADVQARLAEKGLKGLTGELLQQAKAAATLELITEKSADAQTAYAANSDTLVRKQAELGATFSDIKQTLAEALVPVFHRLLEAAAPIVQTVADLVKGFSDADAGGKKVGGVLDLLTIILGNGWKAMKLFYSILRGVGFYLLDKLEPIINFVGTALGRVFNLVVIGFNAVSKLVGSDIKLKPVDIEAFKASLNSADTAVEESGVKDPIEKKLTLKVEEQKGAGSEGDKEAKKLQERLEKLQDITAKFREEEARAALSDEERALAALSDRYDKEIALAKELEAKKVKAATAQRIELERLKEQALAALREEQALAALEEQAKLDTEQILASQRFLEAREAERLAAQQEMQEFASGILLSETEKTLEDLDLFYQELLAKAEEFGLQTADIQAAHAKKKEEIISEEANKELKTQYDVQQARHQALAADFEAVGGIITATFDTLAGESEAFAGFQKVATLAQIAFDTASAISSLIAASEANPTNAVTFGGAGIAQYAVGIIRILTNIAKAKQIIGGVTLPQRKTGGWWNVRGEDDRRTYKAQYLGKTKTGMLPSAPVVLASEAGAEYFVAHKDLQNPFVLSHVRAIENLVAAKHGIRQFVEGGATAALPTGNNPAPAQSQTKVDVNQAALVQVIQQLNNILGGGIHAVIDDDTILAQRKRFEKINRASGGVLN